MSEPSTIAPIREAVGIFFGSEKLEETIQDLQDAGFQHDEIGLLAGKFTVRQKLGHLYEEINEDSADPEAPDTAFVAKKSVGDTVHALVGTLYMTGAAVAGGAVVASAGILGGAVAAAAATTAVFSGIGALLAVIIHESDAEYLEEQVDEGHLLLFVRTRDEEKEKLALEILSRHAAYDPRVYTVTT
ncbi:MAG: hypothetical protein R3F50_02390 [Gammaproteobacteria bacterium]|jgi:hypothetical protein